MAGSSFGTLFRFTSWGESHGPAIGCVVDGTPPRIPAQRGRHPGLDGQAPARPVALRHPAPGARHGEDPVRRVRGRHHRHADRAAYRQCRPAQPRLFGEIKDKFRPSHADYTYFKKYGVRDYRGGGRQSARETAVRVAAGAIARKILGDGVRIRGAVVQLGTPEDRPRANGTGTPPATIPSGAPTARPAQGWEGYLDDVRKRGSSCGAVIEVVASGVAVGTGRSGLRQARCRSRQGADEHQRREGRRDRRRLRHRRDERRGERRRDAHEGRPAGVPQQPCRRHPGRHLDRPGHRLPAGREAHQLDPPPVRSVDRFGNEVELRTKGRHDPCVGIRATPVAEAMVACVLADHLLRHRAQCG